MKNKFIYLLLIIINFGTTCNSQENQFDNSIIWEIRKTIESKPSYILGTIHEMDTTQLHFPIGKIENLIDSCKVLCQEVIIDKTSTSAYAKKIFLADNDKNVINGLDSAYFKKLSTIIDSSKHVLFIFKDKRMLKHIHPAMLAIMLTAEKQSSSKLFSQGNFATEQHFQKYAEEHNYKLKQLETYEQQLSWILMENSTFEEKIAVLKKAIDDFHSKNQGDMFLKYKNQNLKLLDEDIYADSIMVLRNQRMADGIDTLLIDNESVFVMIGAAHLPYKTGVLNILYQKGFQIKPYIVDLDRKE